jgi:hypothetical protein
MTYIIPWRYGAIESCGRWRIVFDAMRLFFMTMWAIGFIYTAWSEWFNTRMAGTWAYAPSMPLVFGIGASPLIQWLLIPGALVFLLKRSGRT